MKPVASRFVASTLAVVAMSTSTMAQSYYDDQACRSVARPGQFSGHWRYSTWRWSRGGAWSRRRWWTRRRDRSGLGCDRRHRRRRRQCPECRRIPAATIQCILRAVHGIPEISTTAIYRTGAGLCTGYRICPADELSAAPRQRQHQRLEPAGAESAIRTAIVSAATLLRAEGVLEAST